MINKKKFDCAICKAVVSGIKHLVKSDYSQDKIRDALSKVCSKLHKFGSKCQHFVDTYSRKLIELLANAATRNKVCRLIKLCTADLFDEKNIPQINDENQKLLQFYLTPEVSDVDFELFEILDRKKLDCPLCKAVVSGIKALVKSDYSQNKIKGALSKVCSKLHKFGSKCQRFVNAYSGKLVELLTNAATRDKVCKLLKICATDIIDGENSIQLQPNDVEIGECLLCKGIVKAVKAIVKRSFTRDQVKRALGKACRKVHSNRCQSFVNKHFNQLVDLISDGSRRGRVCNIIMVCSNDLFMEVDVEEVSEYDQEQMLDQFYISDLNSEMSDIETIDKKKFNCPICKAVVSGIKALVKSDYSQNKIKDALSKVCSKLHKFGSKCQHFVDAYSGKLVELLTNAATRDKVCKLLKICATDIIDGENSIQLQPNDVEIGECLLCKGIVKAVKEIVKRSFTRDQVKRALGKACRKVHSNRCQSFVNKHFNQLVDLISDGSRRGRVCNIIMVCSNDLFMEVDVEEVSEYDQEQMLDQFYISDLNSEMSEIESIDKKKFNCRICKAVVSGIKALVKSDYSQNKIKDALSKICSKLHKFGSKCQHFVDVYSGKLIELLTNAATRDKVCKLLKICATDITDGENSIQLQPNDVEIGECLLCKGIVKAVKEIVKRSFTRDQVKRALGKACRKVHSNRCQSFVNKHFNQLVDLISDGSKRGRVCNIIMVCSNDLFMEVDVEEVSEDNQEHMLDQFNISDLNSEMSDIETIDKNKFNCPICKAVVSGIKALVKSDYSQNKIKDALSKVCSKLHKFGSKCQHFVDAYSGKLIELLTNAATRDKVCRLLKICTGDFLTSEEKNFEKFYGFDDETTSSLQISITEIDDVGFGECLICKAVVKIVEEAVKHSRTRENIRKELEKACHKIHFRRCEHFVKKHLDQLLELIFKATKTNAICHLIKVCSIEPEMNLCQSCQVALSVVKTLPHEYLTKLCDLVLVSPQLRNICRYQINIYWSSFLNIIRTLQDNEMCHNFKVCNSQFDAPKQYDVANIGINMCKSCEMYLSLLKSLVQNKNIAALIHDILNSGCNFLVSPSIISICHREVSTHWLAWLNILKTFQEVQVCRMVKLCGDKYVYVVDDKIERCESCKAIINLVKTLFKMPSFSARVQVDANKICDMLSLQFRSTCHNEVNMNWQKWIASLQDFSDVQLCNMANMCP